MQVTIVTIMHLLLFDVWLQNLRRDVHDILHINNSLPFLCLFFFFFLILIFSLEDGLFSSHEENRQIIYFKKIWPR